MMSNQATRSFSDILAEIRRCGYTTTRHCSRVLPLSDGEMSDHHDGVYGDLLAFAFANSFLPDIQIVVLEPGYSPEDIDQIFERFRPAPILERIFQPLLAVPVDDNRWAWYISAGKQFATIEEALLAASYDRYMSSRFIAFWQKSIDRG